jgi:hypothetical protein
LTEELTEEQAEIAVPPFKVDNLSSIKKSLGLKVHEYCPNSGVDMIVPELNEDQMMKPGSACKNYISAQ